MRKIITLMMLLFLFYLTPCYANPSSMQLGNASITLGEDKLAVLFNLSKSGCEMQCLKGNLYGVSAKDGARYIPLGLIEFDSNNKVTWISRNWGSFHDERQAATIVGLLENIISTGDNTAIVTVMRKAEPDYITTILKMTFKNRVITYGISKLPNGTYISIDESIGNGNKS